MVRKNESRERIGVIGENNYGSKMKVVGYKTNIDILVEFLEHGNVIHTSWQQFSKGNVKNVYDKTIYGIGYIGDGKYKTKSKNKIAPEYSSWRSMFVRCYDEEFHKKQFSYIDCTVADEWHNFQNFAEWYRENYYEVDGQTMHLDKDILLKGNKIYSKDTCIFVPKIINNLFIKREERRGKYPIGVYFQKKYGKYMAYCNVKGKGKICIGFYENPEIAFQAYKTYKEKLIKEIANQYKDKIPVKLYDSMLKYKVEITD